MNKRQQGKQKYLKETCPSAALFPTDPVWFDKGSNPDLRGGKLATNQMSYTSGYKSFTSWGLEHETFWLVAQYLNYYTAAKPTCAYIYIYI
jgi:hypothetical protein